MADAVLLAPTAPRAEQTADASARPIWLGRSDVASAMLGLLSLAGVVSSLWPGLGAPAWPAASAGLLALSLSWLPGRVTPKAVGSLAGFLGLVLAGGQILLLGVMAAALT